MGVTYLTKINYLFYGRYLFNENKLAILWALLV